MSSGIYKHKKGYKRPYLGDQWRANLSKALKGRKVWNTGMKFSYKPRPTMKGRIPWNKGKKGLQTWSEFQRKIHSEKIGEKHPSFTGTNLDYYKKQIKIRDDYTCQICGLRDIEIIQVDHILPISKNPELRLDMKNMRCLCPNCHARKSAKEKRKINGLALASVKNWNGLA